MNIYTFENNGAGRHTPFLFVITEVHFVILLILCLSSLASTSDMQQNKRFAQRARLGWIISEGRKTEHELEIY